HDSGIALRFLPSLVPEALREQPAEVRVTQPNVRMRHALGMLLARIARKDDPCFIDEQALELLCTVAGEARPEVTLNRSKARAKIDRVRAALAERPEAGWTLSGLAELVGYSPFHLARQFRAHTGTCLPIARGADAKIRRAARCKGRQRHEIGAPHLRAIDAERVHLPEVAHAVRTTAVSVVRAEEDDPVSKYPGLALNARDRSVAVIDR